MKWLMALMLAATVTFGGTAVAHDTTLFHYHVGKTQAFQGLVCQSRMSAMHIFNTWMEVGADSAQGVFSIYQTVRECDFFTGYLAYFVERIIGSIAPNLNGNLQNIVVFSIGTTDGGAAADFLVTWEELPPEV